MRWLLCLSVPTFSIYHSKMERMPDTGRIIVLPQSLLWGKELWERILPKDKNKQRRLPGIWQWEKGQNKNIRSNNNNLGAVYKPLQDIFVK